MGQRLAVTKKMATAYRRGGRAEKSRILDQLVELTGWHRDHARSRLRDATVLKVVVPRSPRTPKYPPQVVVALIICWRVTRSPAGKRLAPMLAMLVPLLRRDNEIVLSNDDAVLLIGMSPATIDRRLGPERKLLYPRGRSHTKPGTLLKSQIPIRTWAEWTENMPGFVEIDLVGHEGGNSSGEFCFTLTMTDIATGWTVNRSVKNKAAIWVFEAIKHASRQFPFPILGIDSDNGSEFINAHLLAYCVDNKITFTRSRPGNKNDGSHVEQKNWTHVRELVGYLRFDTEAELAVLNRIWTLDQSFTNHLLAQQKLISRVREGSKIMKRHDHAQTPVQRTTAWTGLAVATKESLETFTASIRPADLSRQILDLTRQLEHLALAKALAPIKPAVNRAFNHRPETEIPTEATNQPWRRI